MECCMEWLVAIGTRLYKKPKAEIVFHHFSEERRDRLDANQILLSRHVV